MSTLEKAFLLAAKLHASQQRKASIVAGTPYISHLLEVAGMVLANGGNEIVGAAALLHDAVEDQGDWSQQLILEQCGPDVLALVLECTEQGTGGEEKTDWWERKRAYLKHQLQATPEALLISVADKLQSLREVRRQVRIEGVQAYRHFVRKECPTVEERKEAFLWFQRELVIHYQSRLSALLREQKCPFLAGIQALLQDFVEVVQSLSGE